MNNHEDELRHLLEEIESDIAIAKMLRTSVDLRTLERTAQDIREELDGMQKTETT
jgi:hypothetical protein